MQERIRKFFAKNNRVILVGIICLIVGVILASGLNWTASSRAEKVEAERSVPANVPLPVMGQSPFVAVAKKVAPAVVNIRSKKYVETPQ